MVEKIYFIYNSRELDEACEKIKFTFPCWIHWEFVELDYTELTIKARVEDLASIERILAPLV